MDVDLLDRPLSTSLPSLALPQHSMASPAPPLGVLPRKVVPPSSPTSLQDGSFHSRNWQQEQGAVRLPHLASSTSSQELPPIRDVSNASLKPGSRGDLMSGGGFRTASRASRQTSYEVRHDVLNEAYSTCHEIEQLKKQVTRLTHLRRERDSYIEQLLADAETTQKRHEAEMARQAARSQREVSERLAGQRREHELAMEDARKALTAALSSQAQSLKQEHEIHKTQDHSLESAAKIAELQKQIAGVNSKLRQQCQNKAMQVTAIESSYHLHLVLSAWRSAAESEICQRAHVQEMNAQAACLGDKARAQCRGAIEGSKQHWQHVTLRAWAAAVAVERRDAARIQEFEEALREANAEHATAQEDATQHIAAARSLLQDRTIQMTFARSQRVTCAALFAWRVALRDSRREAAHRYQMITAEADHSSEIFRLRNEGKKVTVELRKQRRAHGVAAIHASLDRRLQAVVHAWAMVAGEAQRGASYQRQLDIAAAESAASCAVLRMEGRRCTMELRHQRRSYGVRAIQANTRQIYRTTLSAWITATEESRFELMHWRELFRAAAEAAAASALRRAETSNHLVEVEKWVEAHSRTLELVDVVADMQVIYRAWCSYIEQARQQRIRDEYVRATRDLAYERGVTLARILEASDRALTDTFRAWRSTAVLSRAISRHSAEFDEQKVQSDRKIAEWLEIARLQAEASQAQVDAASQRLVEADARHRLDLRRLEDAASTNLAEAETRHIQELCAKSAEDSAKHAEESLAAHAEAAQRAHALRQRAYICGETVASALEQDTLVSTVAAWRGETLRTRLQCHHHTSLETALAEQSRTAASRLIDAETRHQCALQQQVSELQAQQAALAKQHSEAARALLADAEARHAEALKARSAAANAQLSELQEHYEAKLQAQDSELRQLRVAND